MTSFPKYVVSKNRPKGKTAQLLLQDGIDFLCAIEPQNFEEYRKYIPEKNLLVLPFSNLGRASIPARNFVWSHAITRGAKRHWVLDDNIEGFYEHTENLRLGRVSVKPSCLFEYYENLVKEKFSDVAIIGPNYKAFVPDGIKMKKFFKNHRVYSCILIRNDLPFRWRGRYNEDTDLCLNAIYHGYTVITGNKFLIHKPQSMTLPGGNTDEIYTDKNISRYIMAKTLYEQWRDKIPHADKVFKISWKFRRPQHYVNYELFSRIVRQMKKRDLSSKKDRAG